MEKIVPCLWFDYKAEEAVNFYVSVFKNSGIDSITRYGPDQPGKEGEILTIDFHLEGQSYLALNGGPQFQFSEALSLMVYCDSQEEIDEYWEKLSFVPEAEQCGWLKDKFGLSWQIIPVMSNEIMLDPDKTKVNRAIQAMLKMKKLDIAELRRAFEGE
jgi:predicted 3-demethylubiquinone-9 3-methyltransferase (glyoxalase superfamily)